MADLTMNMFDEVILKTGASYFDARKALLDADGDVDMAIAALNAKNEGKKADAAPAEELKEEKEAWRTTYKMDNSETAYQQAQRAAAERSCDPGTKKGCPLPGSEDAQEPGVEKNAGSEEMKEEKSEGKTEEKTEEKAEGTADEKADEKADDKILDASFEFEWTTDDSDNIRKNKEKGPWQDKKWVKELSSMLAAGWAAGSQKVDEAVEIFKSKAKGGAEKVDETVDDLMKSVESEAEKADKKVDDLVKSVKEGVAEACAAPEENAAEEGSSDEAAETEEKKENPKSNTINETIDKLKAMINTGNVDRIMITRDGEQLLNIPVNAGLIGGAIGLFAAPWVMIIGAIAAYGAKCKVEVVHKDGSREDVETTGEEEKAEEKPLEDAGPDAEDDVRDADYVEEEICIVVDDGEDDEEEDAEADEKCAEEDLPGETDVEEAATEAAAEAVEAAEEKAEAEAEAETAVEDTASEAAAEEAEAEVPAEESAEAAPAEGASESPLAGAAEEPLAEGPGAEKTTAEPLAEDTGADLDVSDSMPYLNGKGETPAG